MVQTLRNCDKEYFALHITYWEEEQQRIKLRSACLSSSPDSTKRTGHGFVPLPLGQPRRRTCRMQFKYHRLSWAGQDLQLRYEGRNASINSLAASVKSPHDKKPPPATRSRFTAQLIWGATLSTEPIPFKIMYHLETTQFDCLLGHGSCRSHLILQCRGVWFCHFLWLWASFSSFLQVNSHVK